ncbi:hypothetical protein D3OALGA1CA_3656 [Olavius algarvensis associated proteobacterium Delta 3]|nr:hypothetical protein D3OALGA1CA_3656 [Olavius algarvensis associated proteobacterium Delta 3]
MGVSLVTPVDGILHTRRGRYAGNRTGFQLFNPNMLRSILS